MAPDEVARRGDLPRPLRVGLDPAALEEERRADVEAFEGGEQARLGGRIGRSVGVLGVEGQRDAKRSCGYLSIPVMTMPRMNMRWKMKNRITGMIRVMMLPAWISVVSAW
jgi:hypothetical protein